MTARSEMGPSEEEVLLAFAVEEVHDQRCIQHYLMKYPQYRESILDCAAELQFFPAEPYSDDSDAIPEYANAWKAVSERVASSGTAGKVLSTVPVDLPVVALRNMARNLEMPIGFFIQLRDRLIIASTIPKGLIKRLAQEIGVTPGALMTYLTDTAPSRPAAMMRSAALNARAQITFEEAVSRLNFSPAQADRLRLLCAEDTRDE